MKPIVFSICFLSGAAALIYENVWFQLVGLALGNSVWSVTLVLTGFMAGLALGNSLMAHYGSRIRRVALAYSGIELVLGITGLSLVLLLPASQELWASLFRRVLDQLWLLNLLRWSIAFLLLLIPTTAMGMTLPLLVQLPGLDDRGFGVRLGHLYAWNTLGAIAGILASELVLIRWFGLQGTGVVAASSNAMAALLALSLMLLRKVRQQPPETRAAVPTSHAGSGDRWTLARLLAVAFLCGAVMLGLEVVWFRFLQLFFNGTSKVFAAMLAIVLMGLSVGGWLAASLLKRDVTAHRSVRFAALGAGLLALGTYVGFEPVYDMCQSLRLGGAMSFVVLAAFLMAPVAVLSGLMFTLLGQAIESLIRSATRSAGLLTLSNTIGAAAGSVVAGCFLLPGLGMETCFFLAAIAYGFASLLVPQAGAFRGRFAWAKAALLLTYLLGLICFPFGKMKAVYLGAVAERLPGANCIAVREGLTETAMCFQYETMGRPLYHRLMTHHYSMSSTDPRSKRYMKLYCYWPVALHPQPENALLIGYGIGSTAKALTDTPWLKSIDVVDISPGILELSELMFQAPETNPLKDARVHVRVEDGRFFLRTTPQTYDIITAEPPPPKIAGVVRLYSREFFALARSRLAEGGILTYWLPVYQLEEQETQSIIRAFLEAFPDASLWEGGGLNWMLVGTRNAKGPIPEARFVQQWSDPVIGPEMKALGLETPEQLGTTFLADAPFLKQLTEDSLPLTDNFPQRISSDFRRRHPRSTLYQAVADARAARDRFQNSGLIARLWPPNVRKKTIDHFEYQRIVNRVLYPIYGPPGESVFEELQAVLTRTQLRTLPLWLLESSPQEVAIAAEVAQAGGGTSPEVNRHLAAAALAERDYVKACQVGSGMDRSPLSPYAQKDWRTYLFALCMAGKSAEARKIINDLAPLVPNDHANKECLDWMESHLAFDRE